ncbi:hypothetical protein R5R35_004723 [Gryllus longicercus]|uniref:F-box domain-containing protein n=2 Tax=Gryllus longicercus TaxID=2509291 RepID=A0AAN9VDX9_9ORTH
MESKISNHTCDVQNQPSINVLPDEMILKIFSYLDIRDICFSVCAVCKRWNSLTYERTLWKSIKFICSNNMPLHCIENVLRHAPLLQAIELQWRTDVEIIIKELISNCEDILLVNMVCCGKVKGETIDSLFQCYPFLEHLSLDKCWTVEDGCYDVIHKFTNLKSMNISHSRHFSGSMLQQVVNCCPSLVHINIDYIRGISDNDLLYLIELKKHDLLTLILFGESLTDASICSLEKCKRLKKLHLSRCHLMTNKGLKSIGRLTHLRSLKLRFGINLKPKDLLTFLFSKAVSELEYLCLSRSESFTDEAATAVAENCKKLIQLDVVHCPNLTEAGRQILLTNCEQLKRLNFSESSLIASEMIIAR